MGKPKQTEKKPTPSGKSAADKLVKSGKNGSMELKEAELDKIAGGLMAKKKAL